MVSISFIVIFLHIFVQYLDSGETAQKIIQNIRIYINIRVGVQKLIYLKFFKMGVRTKTIAFLYDLEGCLVGGRMCLMVLEVILFCIFEKKTTEPNNSSVWETTEFHRSYGIPWYLFHNDLLGNSIEVWSALQFDDRNAAAMISWLWRHNIIFHPMISKSDLSISHFDEPKFFPSIQNYRIP